MAPPPDPPDQPNQPDPMVVLAGAPSLARLAARGVVRRYEKGVLLICEGDLGDTLYIILDGRLRSFSENERGRKLIYGVYGVGDYVGEMSLDGGRRAASVETLMPTWCSVITRTTLEKHIADEPAFALELIAKVIRLAREATRSAKLLALNDAYGRVKASLESLAEVRPDGSLWIAEAPSQQQIADMAGCVRTMVTKVMNGLTTGGYVIKQNGGLLMPRRLPPRW